MLSHSKLMRVFFGLPVSVDHAERLRQQLLSQNPDITHQVHWVKTGKHHITVCFLGNVVEQKITLLCEAVAKAIEGVGPLSLSLRNISHFLTQQPGMVVVNVQLTSALQVLYNAVDLAVSRTLDLAGHQKRPYRPHITLCRPAKKNIIQIRPIPLINESLVAEELILYQSVPTQHSNQYKAIATFPLS